MEPILTGAAANLTANATEGIFQNIRRHIRYVRIYQENVRKFEEKLETLKAKRTSVQQEVDAALRNVEKIKADVEHWCTRVDEKIEEKEGIVKELGEKAKNKCFIGLCPNIKSRYRLSRNAEKGVIAFDQLISACQFNGPVGYRDVPEEIVGAHDFEAFESREKVSNDVMTALKGATISMIGVYGASGMGKTMLVKEIAKRVRANLFDRVVVVDVTQNPDIQKIQDEIAEPLGLRLQEKSTAARAGRLRERLMLEKEIKILIVLDNIWKKLDLEEVGIPTADVLNLSNEISMQSNIDQNVRSNKRCKILLTSRNQDVLSNEMDVKTTFAVGILEKNEAWYLFKKKAGEVVENPEVRPTAIEVAHRCGRLPLAIATVARALRNKPLGAWEDALTQLQTPSTINFTGISAEAYKAIELSYSHLESEELKQTFLLCGLLGGDASFEYLLRYCKGLGLFNEHVFNTVEKTRNRLLTMVGKLKDWCLLNDSSSSKRVNMHDLIRDVALAIASRDNHVFTLGPGHDLEDWPDAEKMKICPKIILRRARINRFPDGDELNCPQLTFLYVDSTESSVEMPTSFFQRMENLKVLSLTGMYFSSLPSISLLKCLRTLCLDNCLPLGDISIVGEMGSLEILSLVNSNIVMLPEKIGQLVGLKILDLSGCSKLKIIPPGVLSGLSRLEALYMGNSFVQWEAEGDANQRRNASLAEFKHLSCLTTLHVEIPSPELVPRDLFFKKLQRYKISIGEAWDGFDRNEHSTALKLKLNASIDNLVDGVRTLLKNAEALYIDEPKDAEFVLNTKLCDRGSFLHLQNLFIQNGLEIQYILDGNDADKIEFLQLQSLTLENLPELISFCPRRKRGSSTLMPQLEELPLFNEQVVCPNLETLQLASLNVQRIWDGPLTQMCSCFQNLTTLIVVGCHNLKYLFSSSMMKLFMHIRELNIRDCRNVEEVIFIEEGLEKADIMSQRIPFPKLEKLWIEDLPKLMRFSHGGYFEFPMFRELGMKSCGIFKTFISDSLETDETDHNSDIDFPSIFNEKVAFPQLEELRIADNGICRRIWNDQLVGGSFCKLNLLSVCGCDRIVNIFPFTMRERLQNLEMLRIAACDSLEEIFEPRVLNANEFHAVTATESTVGEASTNFVFRKLIYLGLDKLPRFKSFYSGIHTTEWPSLKKIEVLSFDKLKIFASESPRIRESTEEQPLFRVNEVTFPNLEELRLEQNKIMNEIWHGQLRTEFFSNLKTSVPSSVSFKNLTTLEVLRCDGFVNLMACSTAESLVQLSRIRIIECTEIVEIIASEGDEVEGVVVFTHLKYLELGCLPSLACFCTGDYSFEFPSLEKVIVRGCPKMETFSHGYLSTPMLQSVQFLHSEDEARWEDDLNATIQLLYREKVGDVGLEPGNMLIAELFDLLNSTKNPQAIEDLCNELQQIIEGAVLD